MTKRDANTFVKELKHGLRYPWGKGERQWNILWILLPIFGWFALLGYTKKIVRSLVKGDDKALPRFGSFWKNFKEGVFIFVFMIPTIVAFMILNFIPFFGGILSTIISVFLVPWVFINFFMKETFDSLWDYKQAYTKVFGNVMEYIWLFLLTIVYQVLYGLFSLVLVGIPGLFFGRNFFLAEFYRKHH